MEPKIEIHNRSIASSKARLKEWNIAAEDKRALVKFLDDLQLGKVNKGFRISDSRACKYLDVLRAPLEYFRKPSSKLVFKDVEDFERALGSGKLLSSRGGPYQHSSRVDIRRALQVYLRWKLGETKARELADWLDTRSRNKTPEFLKESEIETLYKACKSAQERFLVSVLFDSGARAAEFHNIRYGDIELPQGQKSYVKLTLKEEYSKTKGRTISMFWKNSEEAVRDYLREREREGIQTHDPVFKGTYTAARLFLHRLGKKVLARSIHFHLFRHSSATFYASQMNRQQLCIRYGWAFSSDMPDIYISRAGVDMAELEQKFANTDLNALKEALARKEMADKAKEERIRLLEATLAEVKQNFDGIVTALKANPSADDVLRVLNGKRRPTERIG